MLSIEREIKLLPEQLINQTAAGEVIERPASAVKELVDNAIDAGATKIQVQIISADGRSFRVTDNGIGIPEKQIELAFIKHATSKLLSLDDLNSLETRGFRGEALASIKSIAEIICFTKHINAKQALKACFNQDNQLIISPAALAEGTSFEVYNLFSNTPVRLKFLKKPETELKAIEDILKELAIAHSCISFELESKGKQIFQTTGSDNWEQTVREVLRESIDFKYLEIIREELPIMELRGLIAPLTESRSDSKSIITLVNQRPIQCQVMRKAIKSVYQAFLPAGKYPKLILSLTLPMDQIDINVHPTKREIRYATPSNVFKFIQTALEKHLIIHSGQIKTQVSSEYISSHSNNIQSGGDIVLPSVSVYKESNNKDNKDNKDNDKSFINKFIDTTKDNTDLKEIDTQFIQNKTQNTIKTILEISPLELIKGDNSNKSFKEDRGNSTDFCLQVNNLSISGQLSGSQWIRKQYVKFLNDWLYSLDQDLLNSEEQNLNTKQITIFASQKSIRPTLNKALIKSIWERDGWRCVYCSKYLLHPQTAKEALRKAPESWIQRLNHNNKLIKTHLFREHQATIDHYFPYTHNPSLSTQENNLFACCRACNQEKNQSINFAKWQPKKYEAWTSIVKIGNQSFLAGKSVEGNL